ncbi:MAG: hypothetical protein RDU24_14415 [Humidesulfovibrio sp.]|uniref:hypothetical protein n=1 Tax=Humidesulfovibrio sp. TaxID=2910988 RepID=UPI0027EAA147|nr:hypothetical protein [Humidesulfovibrio sp.]MDQ7836572.1 hypothetical protein [Humidesulfovibrio sp.]
MFATLQSQSRARWLGYLWTDVWDLIGAGADETDLRLWLDGARSRNVAEEVIGLGRYGKTLTIVTCTDSDGNGEDEEEEDSLRESWSLRFR